MLAGERPEALRLAMLQKLSYRVWCELGSAS